MSTEVGPSAGRVFHGDTGVALVITLSLLVLVAVVVVAFLTRSTVNQQITGSSSNGVVTQTFAEGETQEIISNLQQEMWDVSGQPRPPSSPSPAPVIFPITSVPGAVPSREVGPNVPPFPGDGITPPDPNAPYSQFGNLVKQSYPGVPTYSGGANSAPTPASSVLTTVPSLDGRSHDGVYWDQPQLVSVSSTAATAVSDLSPLVPAWIYTERCGVHPATYAAGMEPSNNGTLTSTTIVGRYAYNIYDIGGLLNANVAGYGPLSGTPSDLAEAPSYTSKDAMIVPGNKGSVIMADLSGLNLNGTLTTNNYNAKTLQGLTPPATSAPWQFTLPVFRYQPSSPRTWASDFAQVFASGQYGGWLQPFLLPYDPAIVASIPAATPPGATTPLATNTFHSRQDLIAWVNNQLAGSSSPAAWVLPYLTHFSYDTDAPSFTPDSGRPRDTVMSTGGGNDVLDNGLTDDDINPAFPSILDALGHPLIKRRFPLSALALLDNVYPGRPPAASLASQIKYDFGLVWDPNSNCWDYSDLEGVTTTIKKLSDVAALTGNNARSPNFFELLKAAITAGSLGKQWANGTTSSKVDNTSGSYDNDPYNTLPTPTNPSGIRYASINYQLAQIGANIISQTTSNYYPTAIKLNGTTLYGVKDLPYFYRSRMLSSTLGAWTAPSLDMDDLEQGGGYSTLGAFTVQPELWNPHAPNLLAPATNYPQVFRIVPDTGSVGLYARVYFNSGQSQNWAIGGKTPANGPIVQGNYTPTGGPNCGQVSYDGTAKAYIQFGGADVLPNGTLPSPLGSFREPCPLAAPGFPNASVIGYPALTDVPTMKIGEDIVYNGSPAAEILTNSTATIPFRFSPATNNITLGFLLAYYCGGPSGTASSTTLGMASLEGANVVLNLQYSPDLGEHFYTYDQIPSAAPTGQREFPVGYGSQQTETGVRTDPRTHRWGLLWANIATGGGTYPQAASPEGYAGLTFATTGGLNALNYGTGGTSTSNRPTAPNWTLALTSNSLQQGWLQINQQGTGTYYADPDGVYRLADGAYNGATGGITGLAEPMLPAAGNSNTAAAATYDSRPIVLNRPFQSVAELGYVFRDTPWRSLDFFTPASGDAALLDVFTVYGPDPYSYRSSLTTQSGLVAGKVSLNTCQQPVLAALLKGASTTTVFPSAPPTPSVTTLTDSQAAAIAQALVKWTTNISSKTGSVYTQGPLRNPAELVGKFITGTTYSGFSSQLTSLLAGGEPQIVKQQRECVMRSLADSGTTRTWNLLIDLVAQTGQLVQNPTAGPYTANPLQNFVVHGERHVWVSVALDRITGQVIKMQVEPVRL